MRSSVDARVSQSLDPPLEGVTLITQVLHGSSETIFEGFNLSFMLLPQLRVLGGQRCDALDEPFDSSSTDKFLAAKHVSMVNGSRVERLKLFWNLYRVRAHAIAPSPGLGGSSFAASTSAARACFHRSIVSSVKHVRALAFSGVHPSLDQDSSIDCTTPRNCFHERQSKAFSSRNSTTSCVRHVRQKSSPSINSWPSST